jgi:Glycosyl transferase 4-like domain
VPSVTPIPPGAQRKESPDSIKNAWGISSELDRANAASPRAATSWRVIHACARARDVLPVVEGQVAVGMRPYVVTPQGAGNAEMFLDGAVRGEPQPISLLRCWQDVRKWRKSLLECEPECWADVVHAHSFAAGMAAVRNCECVVYDLRDCIEELAVAAGQCEPASWIGRSFRAAEEFVLVRAGAVIVHSLSMKKAAEEQGTPPENIHLIPDPLPPYDEDEPATNVSLPPELADPAAGVIFLAPQLADCGDETGTQSALLAMEAFAHVSREIAGCRLLLEPRADAIASLRQQAIGMGIHTKVSFVEKEAMPWAWKIAHIVLAFAAGESGPTVGRRQNRVCLKALRNGIALLAADLPSNREANRDGRGCLWFDPRNPRDLGRRMALLGGNPGFRRTMAGAGRLHLLETRNVAVIGLKYGEAYRHASSRRKSTSKGPGVPIFRPATHTA